MEAISELWLPLTFLLTLAVISHFIATKFKLSMIVPMIVIGIMIGPSLLNIISDVDVDLWKMVSVFAQLGAIVILFTAGLECDIRHIYTLKNTVIGFVGVIVPWVGGFLLGIIMDLSYTASAILGASLGATSIPVSAGVLTELGVLGTPVGKTIMGAVAIDDIVTMVVLSFSVGMAGAPISIEKIMMLLIAIILFIAIGGFIGARYFNKLIVFVERKTTAVEHTGFILALAITFLYSVVADAIGISAVVGAFLAGTMFSQVPIKEEFEDGTRYLSAIFMPIFFISVGILVYIRGEDLTFGYIFFALMLIVVAILTKMIGCGLSAKLFGMSNRDSYIIGVAMIPRCEVAIVIALYALTLGAIDMPVYSSILLMAIITTLITPLIVKHLMKGKVRKN